MCAANKADRDVYKPSAFSQTRSFDWKTMISKLEPPLSVSLAHSRSGSTTKDKWATTTNGRGEREDKSQTAKTNGGGTRARAGRYRVCVTRARFVVLYRYEERTSASFYDGRRSMRRASHWLADWKAPVRANFEWRA